MRFSRFTTKATTSAAVLAAAMLCALSLGGCATTAAVEASGKRGWNDEGAPELLKKVQIENSSLNGRIEIVDLKSALAGDLMSAQVLLRSKKSSELPLQYRFAWYDQQGMELSGNPAAWNPLIIYAGELRTVRGVAPDPRAREFKLRLRESD